MIRVVKKSDNNQLRVAVDTSNFTFEDFLKKIKEKKLLNF